MQGARANPLTAADVEARRFRATKFQTGYDQDEVDDFLDTVTATLRHDGPGLPTLRSDDVARTTFTTTKYREGYNQAEVDSFLEVIAAELRRRERGRLP